MKVNMRKIAISLVLLISVLSSVFAAEDNLKVKLTVNKLPVAVSFTANKYVDPTSDPSDAEFTTKDSDDPVISIDNSNYKTETFFASAKTNSSSALTLYVEYTDLVNGNATPIPISISTSGKSYSTQQNNTVEGTGKISLVEGRKAIKLEDPTTSFIGMRAISHELSVSINEADYITALEGNYVATLTLKTQLTEI